MEIRKGTVRWFDSRPEKRFGFLTPESGGQEIFFHFNDGEKFNAGKNEPEFDMKGHVEKIPSLGDRIVYFVAMGSKGLKARPWGYESEYLATASLISKRPKPLRYRVVVTYDQTHLLDGKVEEPHVEWGGEEGRTLNELCDRYPRNRYDPLRYFGHDDFNRSSEIQILENGKWVGVLEDPRPVVSDSYRSRRW